MFGIKRGPPRKPPVATTPVPPPIVCTHQTWVPFCQWRLGDLCISARRLHLCTGVWEKGLGR